MNVMKEKRLYSIEFLRIFFVFFIILGHIMKNYPGVKSVMLDFFHTKEMKTYMGVEFFFIIGGFFLYKRIQNSSNIFDLIKKIYIRLVPGLFFIFLICVLSSTVRISRFPMILSLTTGLSIPGEVTGWGDWYVGVYFWCSLLFIGLFHNNIRRGFLWTAVLSYFTLSLKFNAPYEGWVKTYYTIVGNLFIRGVHSMGLGMLTAYLTDKIQHPNNSRLLRIIFTALEVYCFVHIFNSVARTSHSHFNYFEIEIVFVILLVCISHSLGYITEYLNKAKNIRFLSKYTYGVFLGHIPFLKYLLVHPDLGLSGLSCSLIIIMGAIMTGIFEYHIVDKKVVPQITKYINDS